MNEKEQINRGHPTLSPKITQRRAQTSEKWKAIRCGGRTTTLEFQPFIFFWVTPSGSLLTKTMWELHGAPDLRRNQKWGKLRGTCEEPAECRRKRRIANFPKGEAVSVRGVKRGEGVRK